MLGLSGSIYNSVYLNEKQSSFVVRMDHQCQSYSVTVGFLTVYIYRRSQPVLWCETGVGSYTPVPTGRGRPCTVSMVRRYVSHDFGCFVSNAKCGLNRSQACIIFSYHNILQCLICNIFYIAEHFQFFLTQRRQKRTYAFARNMQNVPAQIKLADIF